MADWALSSCERQETSTNFASRGAANSKGAYAQLIASSAFSYSALTIQMYADGGGGQCYLVDIAVGGAGSEVVIVPNILFDSSRNIVGNMLNFTLPLNIPAGTRISARCQEVGGTGTRQVQVTIVGRSGGSNYGPSDIGQATNYGAITASTNGVLIDPGATLNTLGAWAQLTASTTSDHYGLMAILGTDQQSSTLVDSGYVFQIAVGAAAAEIVIGEFSSCTTSSMNRMQVNSFEVLAQIPVGTRISMRSKCIGSGAAAARHPTAIILGY